MTERVGKKDRNSISSAIQVFAKDFFGMWRAAKGATFTISITREKITFDTTFLHIYFFVRGKKIAVAYFVRSPETISFSPNIQFESEC